MSCEVWKIKGENQIGERNKEKKMSSNPHN